MKSNDEEWIEDKWKGQEDGIVSDDYNSMLKNFEYFINSYYYIR